MGLESATDIAGLNVLWPLGTDPKQQGDDHLRLIKSVLKNTFPVNYKAKSFTVFSASGTWTKPVGVSHIYVEGVGGGGAGGGAGSAASAGCAGGGGASGCWGHSLGLIDVSAIASATITIGAGGVGVASATGGSGGSTTISFGGSPPAITFAGGGGGGGSAALFTINGLNGGAGNSAVNARGAGWNGENGLILAGAGPVLSGAGGSCPWGAGGGGSRLAAAGSSAGQVGTGFGAGGGGAVALTNVASVAGGNGTPGYVIIWQYWGMT